MSGGRSPIAPFSGEGGTGPSSLEISAVSRRFGDCVALDECSLSLARGEILALLGPSGCGKTTLLNVVAGFETPDQGTVAFDGSRVEALPPHRRGVGMVFQNYALFPHLSVLGNIAYGLRVLRIPRQEIDSRSRQALALMKLEGLAERYPHEISGGQRQRVAVARALVKRPRVLLMDEAFSALDRNLREAMQIELSLLLRAQQITTILVTHDQNEAFALADRIALMQQGRIVQVGAGEDLYRRPVSRFVLDFLGASNRFRIVRLGVYEGELHVVAESGLEFHVPGPPSGKLTDGAWLHVRPADLRLSFDATAVHRTFPATVDFSSFQGSVRRIVLRERERQIIADLAEDAPAPPVGSKVYLDFDPLAAFLMGD